MLWIPLILIVTPWPLRGRKSLLFSLQHHHKAGRYRTNVWDYAGITGLGSKRLEELSMHPTVKPVALVADAIRDCSKRGDTVLDVFGGSGTALIAAETCGRAAYLLE